jgi:hypothetical protein
VDIISSFDQWLQVFAVAMTATTAENLRQIVVGRVFAPRRTIMGMLRAGGARRHRSAFHRLFASARRSIDRAGLALYDLIRRFVPRAVVCLVGNDTLLKRRGLKMFGAGTHRDPMLSSRGSTVTRWEHGWVVLCVVIESLRPAGRNFVLPIMACLYSNKKSATKWRRTYRAKPEPMLGMLRLAHAHDGDQELHFLGDSAYTSSSMLSRISEAIAVTGRIGTNARIHAPAPPREPGRRGRPRVRGERLATPEEMLDAKGLRRLQLKLYDNSEYKGHLAEQEGIPFKAPKRNIRVVAIEHLRGGRGREVFYNTERQRLGDMTSQQRTKTQCKGRIEKTSQFLIGLVSSTRRDLVIDRWEPPHPSSFDDRSGIESGTRRMRDGAVVGGRHHLTRSYRTERSLICRGYRRGHWRRMAGGRQRTWQ